MNEEFDKFVNTFDMNERNIKRKYHHSLRVQKLCEELACGSNRRLASVIGLLHDYGRFYQWTKYKTFDDMKSIDHGDYAVRELFDKNEISKFYKEEKDYRTIYDAIKYHSKYSISENVDDRFMCEMIRDADKLDILYMYTIDELKLSEEGNISKKIKEEFFKNKLIKFENVYSKIDRSINVLSLVYDLNLKDSYRYLKENEIMEKIYEKILDKKKFKIYIEEVKRYIDLKLREDEDKC